MADHNIIRHENLPPKAKHSDYPALKWHPETGEAKTFDRAEDVPEGYLDHHPASKDDHKAPAPKADQLPLTRDEIKAALKAGNVEFKNNAPTQALYDQLLASVKIALVEAKLEHDANSTDAKALLELFPKE